MFFQRLRHASTFRLGLLVLVLCGVLLTGSQEAGQASAAELQVATDLQGKESATISFESVPNAPAEQVFVRCTVAQVSVGYVHTPNTVGFHSTDCSPSTGEIQYFVVPADSKKADQVLAILLTAKASGRPVSMIYDPNDTSGIAPEVVNNNRKILTLGVD